MCPHEEKLTAWLLGDLPPEEHEAMTRHLEACEACRRAKEELSRVLTPLRTGLEKDRNLHIEPLPAPAQAAPLHSFFRGLWTAPNQGLKRVAVLALTFGTLFTLIGVVVQRSHRPASEAEDVTYISYLQNEKAPPPALAPEPAQPSDPADRSVLAETPAPAEALAVPAPPAAYPTAPAPERKAPALPKIADADVVRQVTQKSLAEKPPRAKTASTAPAAAPAPAKAAKRARAKEERMAENPRPAAALLAKPVRLAGAAAPAPTNAVPTNAVPTNAAPPKVGSKP